MHFSPAFALALVYDQYGGERKKNEPISCDATRSNKNIWGLFVKGGVTPFIEKIHDFDPMVSHAFVNG